MNAPNKMPPRWGWGFTGDLARYKHVAPLALAALLILSTPPPASADLPLARLSAIFPPGGQAGTQFEVGLTGLDLEHAETVYFSSPGISASRLTNEPANSASPRFVVNVASNTAPGLHLLRVGGRFGVSNPRPFVVGDGPEIRESATNHEAKSAQALPLGTLVNGHTEPNAADYYTFEGNKGDRIIAECASSILDSRLRPVLVLSDRHGAEIVRQREGGLLDCVLPEEGAYLITLHDLVYGGGPEYPYRLLVSSKPHLDFILPASGVAGRNARFQLYGRNLPEGMSVPEWKIAGHALEMLGVEIEIPSEPLAGSALEMIDAPAALPVSGFAYRLKSPKGLSNPVLISYASGPVISEAATNRQNLSAQELPGPCEVAGQFYPPGAQHWFAFDGKKGEVFYLEVFSHRLGFPTDPFLVVQRQTKNEKGVAQFSDVTEAADEANQGGPEFNTSHRDPLAKLEVKEDGRYLVQLRDLFNVRAADPGLLFRLSIRHPAPDFYLAALPQPPSPAVKDTKEALLWTPLLRRGEVRPVRVLALRRDNFAGEIAVTVEGLPPGVSCDGATLAGNQNSAMLMLVAGEDVTNWAGAIKIIGRGRVGELEIKREALGGALVWGVGDYSIEAVRARVVPDFFIATSAFEGAPLDLGPGEKKVWETSVAGRITIPVRLMRRADDFNGPVKIKMSGLAQFEGKELEIAAKGTNGTLELDLAAAKVPAGQYSFYLEGQSPGKYHRETPEEIKADAADAEVTERQFKEAEKKAGDLAGLAKESSEKAVAAARDLEKAEAALKVFREKSAAAKDASSSGGAAASGEADLAGLVEKARLAKTEAEKTAEDNAAKAKQASAEKEVASGRAKKAAQKTQPKDVTAVVYSPRFELRVAPSPITLAASVPAVAEAGRKVAVPISITRFFNYEDPVEVVLTPPKGVSGIKSTKGTIGKEQTQTTLTVETSSEAPAGRHVLQLQASLRLNGQELKVEQTLEIQLASRAVEP